MDISRLIDELAKPAAYPFPADAIEGRQTHISAVFLAGDVVYKVKKPVSPGFLDFTTLEKRKHFCDEEVRLNRRLAPDVYLGVVPISRHGDRLKFEGEGEPIEWAVKMRRLPESATLLERLKQREVTTEQVAGLARRIAEFHRLAETSDRIAELARWEHVARDRRELFERATNLVGITVSREAFTRLRELFENELAARRDLIEKRARSGVPRDCHGDLHLDHIYLFPEAAPPNDLIIIDCIEFNEGFRAIDPVADMAFPVMDFRHHGRPDLAHAFADAYFEAAGDAEGRQLLPYYVAYRAAVRGMVDGLKFREPETADDRAETLRSARAHWLLALSALESPDRRPVLLLMAGLPGSGKSTVAKGLAECANFTVVRSDVVRKEIGAGGYEPEHLERTYAECLRRAEDLLFQGKRVIVDATFREERQRQRFLRAGTALGVPARLLICTATPETTRQRLAARRNDASDADWDVHQRLAEKWEPLSEASCRVMCEISTEGPVDEAVKRAETAIEKAR